MTNVVFFCDLEGYTFNILPGNRGVVRTAWALGPTPPVTTPAQLYQPRDPSVKRTRQSLPHKVKIRSHSLVIFHLPTS